MVTEIPNAYFVEVGIYKWHGSPTYTLGREEETKKNYLILTWLENHLPEGWKTQYDEYRSTI